MKKRFVDSQYVASLIGLISTMLFLFPVYWMFVTSIKPMSAIFAIPPQIIPREVTTEAYIDNILNNPEIVRFFLNSVVIALGTLVLTLALAVPVAYALARLDIKGKGAIIGVMLVAQMLPSIMLALPFFLLFSHLGLLNHFIALILANTTTALPFAVLVLRPFFMSIPQGLEEAAAMDGSNRFLTFVRIILPLAKPGLLTVGAFAFLFAWGDLLYALILTTDESIRPLTVYLYTFVGQHGTNWNSLMAVSFVAIIPIILIFIAFQKHIVEGIASGSMK
ncbi:carbohydrate ABC transporter permease [Shouchella clausii]|jgi:multiple sugar transport system permease protein|uniref:carbohydrate ABC transporter permease n=1 Tax=Shouchella clausii TaxID=79880 RepID=UPI000B97C5F6|nr:carbohydrate ABC transporter permease [Shouchella clausii]AST96320.1 sugar ABC transporter permease [Shouchella clausii]MEB5471247.1 carbohydrate ABC transporter permease [Shouchella clausii]PAF13105.1 sugar ABC transporter permease [Shouchella clausii]QNM42677.1 carbohydrate ABC transporter permease [Shouchella clausii]WQG94470.1 carbohydrate ABC transporter permease [Shouchella clausii]